MLVAFVIKHLKGQNQFNKLNSYFYLFIIHLLQYAFQFWLGHACMLQFSMKGLPLNQLLNVTILAVENSLLTFLGCKTYNCKQIAFLRLKTSTDIVFLRRLHFFQLLHSPQQIKYPCGVQNMPVFCYLLDVALLSPKCPDNSITEVMIILSLRFLVACLLFRISSTN